MIKVVGLLTRRPELTHEQFVKHWLEIHGPLAHAVPGVRRYVQSHIVGTRTRPDIPETDVEVDGIAELSYNDEAALARAAALARDEAANRRRRTVHRPDQDLHHRREADHSAERRGARSPLPYPLPQGEGSIGSAIPPRR